MKTRSIGFWLLLLGLLAACGDDSSSDATSGSGTGGATTTTGTSTSSSSASGSASSGGIGGEGGSYEGVNPLLGNPNAELVSAGFQFTEGPVWIAVLSVLRFSDIPANRIYELGAGDAITVWRDPSANTNGNTLAANGDLLMCEHTGRRVARSAAAGAPAPTLVADLYQGMRFNSPNDVIARSDGTIYFTDPTYGLAGGTQEIPFRGVFRVDPQGQVSLVDDAFGQPNGIALSPDESKLYVSDSQDGGLYRYEVAADGSTANKQKLIDAAPSDGMAIDDAGNLYLTTGAGVEVYRADGTPWGVLAVGEQPANVSFGGADRRTLFITARTGLYRATLAVPGLP